MNKINKRLIRILLVTSDQKLINSLKRLNENFRELRLEFYWKKNERTSLKAIKKLDPDVCLIDDRLHKKSGLNLLNQFTVNGWRTPVILLTDGDDEVKRPDALRTGAAYCLEIEKLDTPLFEQTIGYAVERTVGSTGPRENFVEFRHLVETLPVMVYTVEPEPPYSPVYVSPAFEKFGYHLKEWTENADFWQRLLHPEDRERVLSETEKARDEIRETDFEYRIVTKDGIVKWVHDRGRFVYDENEKAVGWQGVIIDITERKRVEQEVQKREKLYLTLAQNIPNTGVLLFDKDFRYSIAEVSQLKHFEFTREMLEGKTLWEVFSPEVALKWSDYYRRALAGETVNIELEKGGRFFQAYIVPVKNETEEIFAGMVLWQDVSERKQTEKSQRESAAQFKSTFDDAAVGMAIISLDGRAMQVNQRLCDMLGYTAEELINRHIAEFTHSEDIGQDLEFRRRFISCEERIFQIEKRFVDKNGNIIWGYLNVSMVCDDYDKPSHFIAEIQNITERKHAEKALVNSERRYRSLGEGIMHQVWTAQPDGKIDYVNNRTLDYFGQTFEQIIGNGWQSMVHPEDLPECIHRWTHSLATGENYETEFRLRRHDGEYCWHQARATAGLASDGKIINWFGTNTDINDRKIAEEKLSHFAGHDTLTNLPNRAKFMNYLERAISRSDYNPAFRFAVLFLDLDRFKVINDSLGHTTGDKLLVALAQRLEECLRPNDIVARLGGDEFTVLLNNINEPNDAVRIAKRFLEKLSVPFNLDAYEVFTSVSIGIIVSDEIKRQPEDFLRDADTAMYRAKEAGKSRYEIFDREMHIRNMNLLQMENDLRRAIGQNEFRVFYQPIIDLETGEIREFEALIRWQHSQHGLVSPNEFISIAEETGLIIPIGKWILEESCRQTAEWQKRFPLYENLSVSVNLSAKQLMHPDLRAQVSGILKNTALDSRFLNLEVTESMVMENGDKALAVISELNRLGIALSTDDFGTGYSSLSYLHSFPFSRLKIDRSFVSKMDSDQKSEAIVRTILLLAQNLSIEVVAEGIETESQFDSLRHLGCKTGQGFFFSKPVPAEAAEHLLRHGLPNTNAALFYGFSETESHQLLELDKVQ